jgi:aminopeptidase N
MPTGTAAADGPDFTPGSPSAGDPYYPRLGNGGYDVRHYDLRLDYQPSSDRLAGVATLSARATQHLSRFNLDLVGMTVHDVWVEGRRAAWSRSGPELSITPREKLRKGRNFTVRVAYGGVPRTLPFPGAPEWKYGWIHTDDGSWALSQPDTASTWFPGNDHPRDLATYDFTVTVPAGIEAIANGRLSGVRRHGGKATWQWRLRSPMATYLATVAVGQFHLHRYRTPGGIPVLDAIDPDVGDIADDELAKQARILAFEQRLFGPYPFEAAGAIVDDYHQAIFLALETQTRPLYDSAAFDPDVYGPHVGELLVVHELAHQWAGDSVVLDRWQDIWLNEGFATYTEWLWDEHVGRKTAQAHFDALYSAPPTADHWSPAPGDPGPDALFDYSVYDRGAMTLHALRLTIGDGDFFRLLRRWITSHRGEHVTTADFVALAEQISGKSLDDLFHAWLFTTDKPTRPG